MNLTTRFPLRFPFFACLLLSLAIGQHASAADTNQTTGLSRAQITAASNADYKRMLGLLGITSVRPGRDGSHTNSPNYAESKANPYPNLPDPLVLNDGE